MLKASFLHSLGHPCVLTGRMSVLNESHNQMESSGDIFTTTLKRIYNRTKRTLVCVSTFKTKFSIPTPIHQPHLLLPANHLSSLLIIAVQSKLNTWPHPEINLLHTRHEAINFSPWFLHIFLYVLCTYQCDGIVTYCLPRTQPEFL